MDKGYDSGLPTFALWLETHKGQPFRYWIYKRKFTPFEKAERFPDEGVFEDSYATTAYIQEAIALPDGDILLGFRNFNMEIKYIEYAKLSEVRLVYCELDENDDDFGESNYEDY